MTAPLAGTGLLPALSALLLGLLGWKAAERARFPAPAMIGPMIAVALAVSAGAPSAAVPAWLRIAAQSMIGGFIGRRIDRASFSQAAAMLPAVAITSAWYLGGTVLIGYLVARWGRIDLHTALLGTAPAGVAEMTALAISSGVDSAFVATMQALRVLVTNLSVPFAVRRSFGAAEVAKAEVGGPGQGPGEAIAEAPEIRKADTRPRHWLFGLAAALVGGWLFTWMKVPAGAVVGGMLAVAALRISGFAAGPIPRAAITGAYIVLGISVGLSFDAGTWVRLRDSAGVIAFGTAATLAGGLILARIVRRVMGLDSRTALLACSPAGLSLMAVIAEETGAQTLVVSLFQLVRVVWVILAVPFLLRYLG